jgi:hypothetical protein
VKVDISLRWLYGCLTSDERFSSAELEKATQDAAFDWDKVLLLAHRGFIRRCAGTALRTGRLPIGAYT